MLADERTVSGRWLLLATGMTDQLPVVDGLARPWARGVFVVPALKQQSHLAARLGCALLNDGAVQVNELGQTTVPGVYAAGDLCRTPAMPQVAAQSWGAEPALVLRAMISFS